MEPDEYEYLEKTGDIPKPEKLKDPVNGSEKIDKSLNKDPSGRPKQKSNRHDQDFDHRVKCSRKGNESHRENDRNSSLKNSPSSIERDRNERGKRRRRWESKNRDMDKDRKDSRRKETDGDKIRESNGERCRKREKRDRDYVYERDTEKEMEQERSEREREQERSNHNKNHPERYQDEWDRERSRENGRSHDMEYKEKESVREVRENDPESRRTKVKKEEVVEAEAEAVPDRDQRTVFAYQINLKADERDVYEFFSRAGKVRDVHLIMDHNSRCCKGFGYIEFYDAMSVPVAIALSGQPLLGQTVMVKLSEAEKNLVQTTTVAAGAAGLAGPYSGEGRQLYVGNLHQNIKEDQLRQIFEPFGAIELVRLPSDPETGHSKGYGFVQFARLDDARAAQSLDGQLEIAGQVMKVSSVVTYQAAGQEAVANADDFGDNGSGGLKVGCAATPARTAGDLGDASTVSPPAAAFGQTPIPVVKGLPTAFFSILAAVPSINTIGVPSECLLLKNMFDPKVESGPDFDQDIKVDVEGLCTKFGDLKHIYLDKNSAGSVYLRFQNGQSAFAAQRALHGRWFAGKMITATFVVPQDYEVKFPLSK